MHVIVVVIDLRNNMRNWLLECHALCACIDIGKVVGDEKGYQVSRLSFVLIHSFMYLLWYNYT